MHRVSLSPGNRAVGAFTFKGDNYYFVLLRVYLYNEDTNGRDYFDNFFDYVFEDLKKANGGNADLVRNCSFLQAKNSKPDKVLICSYNRRYVAKHGEFKMKKRPNLDARDLQEIDHEMKLVNQMIEEAVMHGGDSGGAYFTNGKKLNDAVLEWLKTRNLSEYYTTDAAFFGGYDSYVIGRITEDGEGFLYLEDLSYNDHGLLE